MPIIKKFVCDGCDSESEPYNYYTVEKNSFKPNNGAVMDIYYVPQPQKTFCSINCLVRYYDGML